MKISKKLTILALFILMLTTLTSTGVYANYQSIPSTSKQSTVATTWITGIRQMESEKQGMGLTETIGSDGIATTESNNIDVHMIKNTEYGAILLLGASDYGKQGDGAARYMNKGATDFTANVQASTTGNVYGVYEIGYTNMSISGNAVGEVVAGGAGVFLPDIAPRYINRYTESDVSTARIGDATVETSGWNKPSSGNAPQYAWISSQDRGFRRGVYSEFAYQSAPESTSLYCRGVAVCGAGF